MAWAANDNANYIQQLEDDKVALTAYDQGHDQFDDGTSIRTLINRNTPAVRKLVSLVVWVIHSHLSTYHRPGSE